MESHCKASAWSVGSRLQARELDGWPPPVTSTPPTLPGPDGGYAVLFRFGAVGAVGLGEAQAQRLVEQAVGLAVDPRPSPVSEEADIVIEPQGTEGVDAAGRLVLRELSPERAQVVASVLAKSAVLGDYEGELASVFERIEPFAAALKRSDISRGGRKLVHELGDVLLSQSRMVGRAEIGEKPDVTWEDPALDRLYERLAAEYELRDREHALARKLELISQAASTYLGLLSDRRVLRVEWYIVLLILVEIVILVYDMVVGH